MSQLLSILEAAGVISPNAARTFADQARARGSEITIRNLACSELATEESIAKAVASFYGLPFRYIPKEFNGITSLDFSVEYARFFRAVPMENSDGTYWIFIDDPTDLDKRDAMAFLMERSISFLCTTPSDLDRALHLESVSLECTTTTIHQPALPTSTLPLASPINSESSLSNFVASLLDAANGARASDIHIEPYADALHIRFRIDGVLHDIASLPTSLHTAIVNRLKVLTSTLSQADSRLPQDGRASLISNNQPLDLRVSIVPCIYGESVAIRLLDRCNKTLPLDSLGLDQNQETSWRECLALPNGLLLVTGPTGSGKTTTLYACLESIKGPHCKIITVEDPVEYAIPGINQVPVDPSNGLTFPKALRAILRQAPSVIMIGEIRDRETAAIAIQAALTGHLVLATLHANNATSTVARLVDLGIEPFLVASALRAVLAQRLVRRLCNFCKHYQPIERHEWAALMGSSNHDASTHATMKASGCSHCRQRGFEGRTGIFELFKIMDTTEYYICQKAAPTKLYEHARINGMHTLFEHAMTKVLSGETSLHEALLQTRSNLDSSLL